MPWNRGPVVRGEKLHTAPGRCQEWLTVLATTAVTRVLDSVLAVNVRIRRRLEVLMFGCIALDVVLAFPRAREYPLRWKCCRGLEWRSTTTAWRKRGDLRSTAHLEEERTNRSIQ